MKRNLLIFHPAIGSYRVDLFNALSESFNTRIFVNCSNPQKVIYDAKNALRLLNILPSMLQKSFKIKSRQFYKGYWRAIKENEPDIILVSEFGIDAIAAILYKTVFRNKYKIVSICDDSYHMLTSDSDFTKLHKLTRKILAPLLDNIILADKDSQRWFQNKFKKGIYFPIVSDENRLRKYYQKALPISTEYYKKFDLEGKVVFLYVGRLVKVKNLDTLIRAFNESKLENKKLIIVGDGDLFDYLTQLSSNNPDIIFTGRLTGDKLNAWYNIADALILPSKVEPFGAVTNEALIGGCKVLVSKNAGSRCLIEDEVNGYVINPDDINSLSKKIQDISSQIQPKSKKNFSKVRDSLMTDSFQTLFNNLYNELNK